MGAAAGQATWEATQVAAHFPFEQSSPAGHTLPQLPQFSGSVEVEEQKVGVAAGQATWLAEQVCTHFPPEQSSPAAHTAPQPPQLFGSFEVLAQ